MALDLFVLFSSATAVLGSQGQGAYTAANAFLDALAHERRRQGLPATAVNWGAWAEAGMAAHGVQAENLARQGILGLAPDAALDLLGRILRSSPIQVTALAADWPRLCERFPLPLLAELAQGAAAAASPQGEGRNSLLAELRELAPPARHSAMIELLRGKLAQVLRTPAGQLDPQRSLAELGIDSLTTVELVYHIETAVGVSVPLPALLQGPTTAGLASLVLELLEHRLAAEPRTGQASAGEGPAADGGFACAVAELAGEARLDPAIRCAPAPGNGDRQPENIFLTGASGFLGAYLLRDLLGASTARIHCLVRGGDESSARARLLHSLQRAFPDEPLAVERITVLAGDLTQPLLGLGEARYERLAEECDLLLHNGAEVNWLAPYARLKPANVQGTEAVVRLAAHRQARPLHYISSLAVFPVVGRAQQETIDERAPLDHGGILQGGYTQSKWVAEKLVAEAKARGLPVAIYRPSLVVGDSRTGTWYGESIIAAMLRSWVALGIAPEIEAPLDLAPVDYVSRAVVNLLLRDPTGGTHPYHLANAQAVTVVNLIDWLAACGYSIRKVPYAAWRAEMLSRTEAGRQVILSALGPLLALQISEDVGWLANVPRFDDETTTALLTCARCPVVDGPLLRAYVSHLQQTGFLPPE